MLAAIDLGSNSFRLHVGRHVGNTIEVVRSAREPTRIASGLDDKNVLSNAVMQHSIDALFRLGDVLQAYRPLTVRAVATNTLRVAKNVQEFLPAAEKALGHPIDVISGDEEARLIYLGLAHQVRRASEHRLVIDIGGGSTEVIVGSGQEVEQAQSISLGTVWQTQQFFRGGKIDATAFDAAVRYARSRFDNLFPQQSMPEWKNVYGSSGTMRAIGEIITRNNLGDEGITPQSLDNLKQRFLGFGSISQIALEKVRPERAESIVGGLAILIALMQELGINKLRPIEGGLRLGVMWDLYLRRATENKGR